MYGYSFVVLMGIVSLVTVNYIDDFANNNYDMSGEDFLVVRNYINQDISYSGKSGNYIGYDFDLTIMTAAGDITVTKGLSEFWTNLQPTDEQKKLLQKLGKKTG